MYDYRLVEVLRVVDGDTLDVRLDLGFYVTAAVRVRLMGVDTPERGEPGWSEATVFSEAWVTERRGRMRARTQKADSFGRWLADIYDLDGHGLSEALIHAGHAVPYRR